MNRYEMDKERENFRTVLKKMFSITEDAASNEEIRDRILSGGKITGTNMVVMICAILIASVGLNTNSIAVIIGAMLISPLMGSILAISYGTVSNDAYLIKRHSFGFAVQIVMSVVTATIYFLLSPVKEPTEQLHNRGHHLARAAPVCIHIHKHRDFRQRYILIKICTAQYFYHIHLSFSSMCIGYREL